MDQHLAFLQSQAAYIEPQVYMIRYASIQYPALVPVDTSAPPFSGQITYYSEDGSGQAEFLANRGDDFPLVNLTRQQHNVRIENLGIGYEYDMFELGQAQMLSINLTVDKARIARRVAEEKIDDIVISGQPDMGWDGLINQSNVAVSQAGKPWDDDEKTSDEILYDINNALSDVYSTSRQVEMADTVLLDPNRWAILAQRRIPDTNITIGTFLKENNIYTMTTGRELMIRTLRQLATAGAGGSRRMIVYRRSPEVLRLHYPMVHRFLPAQQMLTKYCVPGVFRLGGLEIRLPGAIRYVDGI